MSRLKQMLAKKKDASQKAVVKLVQEDENKKEVEDTEVVNKEVEPELNIIKNLEGLDQKPIEVQTKEVEEWASVADIYKEVDVNQQVQNDLHQEQKAKVA